MSRPRKKMNRRDGCIECGLPLYQHRRCVDCRRFVWCTAVKIDVLGQVHHSHGCFVGVA